MHTGTLMSRRKALLKCEESFELSDCYGYKIKPLVEDTKIIEFKDSIEWKEAYQELKNVLKNREHLLSKKERKLIRQKNRYL